LENCFKQTTIGSLLKDQAEEERGPLCESRPAPTGSEPEDPA
jgi:hypothetical protein